MEQRESLDIEEVIKDASHELGFQIASNDPVVALIAVHDKVLGMYEKRWLVHTKRLMLEVRVLAGAIVGVLMVGVGWLGWMLS